MKKNELIKGVVPKEDKKRIKAKQKEIRKLYRKLFSKSLMRLSFLLRIIYLVIILLGPIVTTIVITISTSIFGNYFSHANQPYISTLSNAMFIIATSFFGSVILSIIISAFTDNEYFGRNESIMFFRLRIIGLPILLLFIDGLIGEILLVLANLTERKQDVVMISIITIVYSTLIVLKYVHFKTSNQINKYFIYLKSTNRYENFKLDKAIKDNICLVSGKMNADTLTNSYKNNTAIFSQIETMLNKLKEKSIQGHNVTKEQNIIEDYIGKLFKKALSPQQLFMTITILKIYLEEYLVLVNKLNNTKEVSLSITSLLESMQQRSDVMKEISDFEIDKKDLAYLFVMPHAFKEFVNKAEKLLKMQKIMWAVNESAIKGLEKSISSLSKKDNKIYKPLLETARKKCDKQYEKYCKNNDSYLAIIDAAEYFYTNIDRVINEKNKV